MLSAWQIPCTGGLDSTFRGGCHKIGVGTAVLASLRRINEGCKAVAYVLACSIKDEDACPLSYCMPYMQWIAWAQQAFSNPTLQWQLRIATLGYFSCSRMCSHLAGVRAQHGTAHFGTAHLKHTANAASLCTAVSKQQCWYCSLEDAMPGQHVSDG